MITRRDEHMGKTLTYIIHTEVVLVTTDLSVFLPFVFLKPKFPQNIMMWFRCWPLGGNKREADQAGSVCEGVLVRENIWGIGNFWWSGWGGGAR